MNKRTKFTIGASLLISAATTAAAFVALSVQKKSPWKALLAITATEGLVGLALMQNKLPVSITITTPRKIDLDMDDVEFFVDAEEEVSPLVDCEVIADEEAGEADPV